MRLRKIKIVKSGVNPHQQNTNSKIRNAKCSHEKQANINILKLNPSTGSVWGWLPLKQQHYH